MSQRTPNQLYTVEHELTRTIMLCSAYIHTTLYSESTTLPSIIYSLIIAT